VDVVPVVPVVPVVGVVGVEVVVGPLVVVVEDESAIL